MDTWERNMNGVCRRVDRRGLYMVDSSNLLQRPLLCDVGLVWTVDPSHNQMTLLVWTKAPFLSRMAGQ